MRTIELAARIDEQGHMQLALPLDVMPGEYQVVVVIAGQELSITAQPNHTAQLDYVAQPPLLVQMIEWDIIPEKTTFSREELYEDVTY